MANEICSTEGCNKVIGVGDYIVGHKWLCKDHHKL